MKSIRLILFFLIGGFFLQAQNSSFRGRILTHDGQPAEHVSVIVKGTDKATTSDGSGEYLLQHLKSGKYIILYSYIGLQTQQKTVELTNGVQTVVDDVILAEDSKKLKEVEVVAHKRNPFSEKTSQLVAKLPLTDMENPQVYNTIPKALLKEQVVTNLNSALSNATGITRLWESTGRGTDGAEYYSMRGFSLQPTIVN